MKVIDSITINEERVCVWGVGGVGGGGAVCVCGGGGGRGCMDVGVGMKE